MNAEPNRSLWYALQVRTRWEQSTANLLLGKGYEIILPTFKAVKQWRGNTRAVTAPLFPGYVFCRFDANQRLPVLITPGVVSVVRRGSVPAPVEDWEMAAIERVALSGVQAEPFPYLDLGQNVRIEDGPLRGLEGILISFKERHRIVVSVSLLRRSVAVEIDRSQICPIGATGIPALRSFSIMPSFEPAIA
jgi:transcriptional antiterminator NusG